jgi:hypothetical protein
MYDLFIILIFIYLEEMIILIYSCLYVLITLKFGNNSNKQNKLLYSRFSKKFIILYNYLSIDNNNKYLVINLIFNKSITK